MTILFVLRHAPFIRNFEGMIAALMARGHVVSVAFSPVRKDMEEPTVQAFLDRHPGLLRADPPPRDGRHRRLSDAARAVRDHLRYTRPALREARALRARALRKMHPALLHRVIRWRLLSSPLARRVADRLCALIDAGLAADPALVRYLDFQRPDVLVVTPLVDFSYGQVELVKAAHHLGVPVAYPVASWDNLTSKGVIQQRPDRTIVWNETQRAEARDLHGLPDASVKVVGAPLFDMWFDTEPTVDRATYCATLGLDPDRPVLLYVASSPFICPEEADFALEWVAAVRACAAPQLSGANIVIRPHPNNLAQWRGVAVPPGAPTVIRPLDNALPITPDARQDYLTTLTHCDAAIGINTTAFIEAAIRGHPCFSILTPRFSHAQWETPHFSYIARDLLNLSPTVSEHVTQLAETLALGRRDARADAFAEHFARPMGRHRPATPLMAEAIENTTAPAAHLRRGPAPLARALTALTLAALRRLDEDLDTAPIAYLERQKDRRLKALLREIKAVKKNRADTQPDGEPD